MEIFNKPEKSAVMQLLSDNELPVDDVSLLDLNHFFGVRMTQKLQGIVGLELFEDVALLRSLAVAQSAQGKGCGNALVAHIERYAQQNGVKELYLLTTTAERFFARLGYIDADRATAPDAIRQTREFSGICPGSAAFMVKHLA